MSEKIILLPPPRAPRPDLRRTLRQQVEYCRQPFNVGRLLRTGVLTLNYQPNRIAPPKPVSL